MAKKIIRLTETDLTNIVKRVIKEQNQMSGQDVFELQTALNDYFEMATELGMASLIEVHTHDELERAMEISPRIIGINSRNLKTLEVDQSAFAQLLPEIPTEIIKVAESGISARAEVELARSFGADAILVGEALVRAGDPISALRTLRGL